MLYQFYSAGLGVEKDLQLAGQWFVRASEQEQADAMYDTGMLHLNEEHEGLDKKHAEKFFRKAAEQGHADAQMELGRLCLEQVAVTSNDCTEATEWFRKAAKQGNAKAQLALAVMYLGGEEPDTVEAVAWGIVAASGRQNQMLQILRENPHIRVSSEAAEARANEIVAEIGTALAQSQLAFSYLEGHAVKRSEERAFELFMGAARRGDARAEYQVGAMLAQGIGVAKNETEAIKWWRRAAEQGIVDAQHNLGAYLIAGNGVPKDEQDGLHWLSRAARKGSTDSQEALSALYISGTGVPRDVVEGYAWGVVAGANGSSNALARIEALAELDSVSPRVDVPIMQLGSQYGSGDTLFELGLMYVNGGPVVPNKALAMEYFSLASQRGHLDARVFALGDPSKGVAVTAETLHEMEELAEAGSSLGAYLVGDYYEEAGDSVQAVKWYELAAMRGHPPAECQIGRMYKNGDGVEKDAEKACQWLLRAVEGRNLEAAVLLADMAIKGEGMEQDKAFGISLFRSAALSGHEYARTRYCEEKGRAFSFLWAAKSLGYGEDLRGDPIDYLRKAALFGDVESQLHLAQAYREGSGILQDDVEALAWASVAASRGNRSELDRCMEASPSESLRLRAQQRAKEMAAHAKLVQSLQAEP